MAWQFLFLGFLILVLLRVSVGFALILPSVMYLIVFDVPFTILAQKMVRTLFSFTLLSIPLFIYTGSLMNETGQTDRIFQFANDAIGHFKGGLAYVNILASLIFSGISGSALADIGGIGQVLMDAMGDNGYEDDFSAAITSASGTIGPIFPPSIPLIIFGVLTETSVLNLLLAGLLPALLCVALLVLVTRILAIRKDFPTQAKTPLEQTVKSFVTALPAILAPVILIGGMLFGIFGPSEVAAVAVSYIIAINFLVYREFDVGVIWEATKTATRTTTKVFVILMGASLFGWILTIEGMVSTVGGFLAIFGSNTLATLLFVNIVLLVLGLFLEPLTALVMSIPVFVPPLVSMGVHPVHLGLIMVFNLMIGLLTPPMGLTLFMASDISGASIESVIRELLPYYAVLLLTLVLIVVFPDLSLKVLSLT